MFEFYFFNVQYNVELTITHVRSSAKKYRLRVLNDRKSLTFNNRSSEELKLTNWTSGVRKKWMNARDMHSGGETLLPQLFVAVSFSFHLSVVWKPLVEKFRLQSVAKQFPLQFKAHRWRSGFYEKRSRRDLGSGYEILSRPTHAIFSIRRQNRNLQNYGLYFIEYSKHN